MAHTKTEPNDCKITYYDTVSAKKVEWFHKGRLHLILHV